jgi:pimeloyl-ACP methyl ester carboxylesterase
MAVHPATTTPSDQQIRFCRGADGVRLAYPSHGEGAPLIVARLLDLEAVIDAAGLETLAVLGTSGGSAVDKAYAIAHPEHVERLILYGTVCGIPPKRTDDQSSACWASPLDG